MSVVSWVSAEPVVLLVGPERVLADLNQVLDRLRIGHLQRRVVELARVLPRDVDVVRLVVDLRRVDPRGHHEGRVHTTAALVR